MQFFLLYPFCSFFFLFQKLNSCIFIFFPKRKQIMHLYFSCERNQVYAIIFRTNLHHIRYRYISTCIFHMLQFSVQISTIYGIVYIYIYIYTYIHPYICIAVVCYICVEEWRKAQQLKLVLGSLSMFHQQPWMYVCMYVCMYVYMCLCMTRHMLVNVQVIVVLLMK